MKRKFPIFLMSFLILCLFQVGVGTASIVQLTSDPGATWEIGAYARQDNSSDNAVRFAVYDVFPFADYSSGGSDWTTGQLIDFQLTLDDGLLTFKVDFNLDHSFGNGETVQHDFTDYATLGFRYIDLTATDGSNKDILVQNLNINGTTFAGPFQSADDPNNNPVDYYFDLGAFSSDITISGQLEFIATDGPDTPRMDLRLGGTGAVVPIPATALLLGSGLLGLLGFRYRKARKA